MWSNARPPSRAAPGDHYNNNSAPPNNPYSRNAAGPKPKPGRQSTDPWDWGWEDNSSQQDDRNNKWSQPTVQAPNVIPNPPPSLYHPVKPEKPHGTPDLIPEKVNNISRGNISQQIGQPHYSQMSNPSGFFENIDLVAQNSQSTSLPPMYSSSVVRRPQQSNLAQNPQMFQPIPPKNPIRHPTSTAYFPQPNSSQIVNHDSSFYQQHPPIHNSSVFPTPQYFQPELSNQIITQDHSDNYYKQDHFRAHPDHAVSNFYNQGQEAASHQASQDIQSSTFYNQDQQAATKPDNGSDLFNQDKILVPNQENSNKIYPQDQIFTPNHDNSCNFYNHDQFTDHNEEKSSNFYNQDKITSHKQENSNSFYSQSQLTTPNNQDKSSNFYNQVDVTIPKEEDRCNSFNQDSVPVSKQGNYYEQDTYGSGDASFKSNSEEVENIEIAPPERVVAAASQVESSRPSSAQKLHGTNTTVSDETNIPDNQETVPENEEQIPSLSQKLSQMKIHPTQLESWNNAVGWENQEVAPRCELDRNQYLETGQLESNEVEEVPLETENNDEGEALPPPGLHRMVTGQGTESLSERSVLGQPPSGLERLIPGQPTPSVSPTPIQRHPSQRYTSLPETAGELQRLVPGQIQNDPLLAARMVPGQLSDDENNIQSNSFERMIPGGTSEHENSFPGDTLDDERMVPGGMSDDSRSQSLTNDDDTRNSERLIPGMPMEAESNTIQIANQSERLVTGAGSVDHDEPSLNNSQDSPRHAVGHRSQSTEPSQPPLGMHRLVLGQMTATENNSNASNLNTKTSERVEESPNGNPTHGMHRMVVGQFREKEAETENDKEKEKPSPKSDDRDDDSDSDYRSERRRLRHHKDYSDERKERDYSSERDHRSRREDRREYRKKRDRDSSYNRSPEYQSDHEDYERNDYRDRRDRDRRDRPRDRDRRRRSPDYGYDTYYRDDPRKLPPRERERRYYEPYDDDPYYYRENRSRPSSRSGSEYRRHRDYPPRHPYYPDQEDLEVRLRQLGIGGNSLFSLSISQDYANSSKPILTVDQAILGLDRELLVQGMNNIGVHVYMEVMLTLVNLFGVPMDKIKPKVRDIIMFEMHLAKITQPESNRHDHKQMDNLFTVAQLKERVYWVDWDTLLHGVLPQSIQLDDDELVRVAEPEYFDRLELLLERHSEATVVNYMMWRAVFKMFTSLTTDIRNSNDEVFIETMGENDKDWDRHCIEETSSISLPLATLYVKKYMDNAAVQEAKEMIKQLQEEMARNIHQLRWMDDTTKSRAKEKVLKMGSIVGCPPNMTDIKILEKLYKDLKMNRYHFLEAELDLVKWSQNQEMEQLHALDSALVRTIKVYGPYSIVVNALYNPQANVIMIPAAIMQHPLFSTNLPMYINYARLGSMLAHEITHSLDRQGAQFDAEGNLNEWWVQSSRLHFKQRTQCLVDNYNQFHINGLDYIQLNGSGTLSEIVADVGGLKTAFLSYHNNRPPVERRLPGLHEYTNEQIFFLSYANMWCTWMSEEAMEVAAATDPHPLPQYRVNGVLANWPEFSRVFQCEPNTPMNPRRKCNVW